MAFLKDSDGRHVIATSSAEPCFSCCVNKRMGNDTVVDLSFAPLHLPLVHRSNDYSIIACLSCLQSMFVVLGGSLQSVSK